MIAYRPSPRPSIKEQFAVWKAHMATVPDRTLEHIASHCHCPYCGDPLPLRWARWSERWQVYHPLTWCQARGAAWYGATREEAIAEFNKFAALGLATPLTGGGCRSDKAGTGAATFPKGGDEMPYDAFSEPETVSKPAAPKVPPSGADDFKPLQLLPVSGAFASESPELDKKNEAAASDDFEEVNKLLTLPE